MSATATDTSAPLDLDAIEECAAQMTPLDAAALRAATAEVRRLRAELLDARAAHEADLRDDAKTIDDTVARVWSATGETHEPPADVRVLVDRVDALRCDNESLARRLVERDTARADLVSRLMRAENVVAAARREGAEAMREACVRACEDDAASLDAQTARGNVRSAAKSAEARFIASLLRALPLPEVTP